MIATHVFVDDLQNWLDYPRCAHIVGAHGEVCSMPETNRVHKVPEVSIEAARIEARRLGERNAE